MPAAVVVGKPSKNARQREITLSASAESARPYILQKSHTSSRRKDDDDDDDPTA